MVSSRRSASVNSRLVAPGPWPAITASMEAITASEAMRSFFSSSGLFTARSRSSTNRPSTISLLANAERGAGIDRQERELGTDPAGLEARLADVIDRLLHDVDRAGRIGLRLRHPERLVLLLEALHAVTEERRLGRRAFRIDQDRQVAAQAHRIHGLEEEGAMTAEQVLHVVLRGHDQEVDAGLLHQAVEPIRIERDLGRHGGWLDDVEHE